ncbi:hypothetical protein [Kribbella sp. NPDC051718]|uniref:hypothetical protein n=1 Tax=Kribbella sp. NPDC051718 TaxID=3155168 RepID=UPI003431CD90
MKTGDLEPPWIVDISDAGAQADLNTVQDWRFVASLNNVVVFTDTDPDVVVDTTHTYKAAITHSWVSGETANDGTLRAEVVAVWPGGREQTFPGEGHATLRIEPSYD